MRMTNFAPPVCPKHNEQMVLSFYDRPGGAPGNGWTCRSCITDRTNEMASKVRRDCDVSRGDIQCPAKLPHDGGHLCCRFITGHGGKHQTSYINGEEWDEVVASVSSEPQPDAPTHFERLSVSIKGMEGEPAEKLHKTVVDYLYTKLTPYEMTVLHQYWYERDWKDTEQRATRVALEAAAKAIRKYAAVNAHKPELARLFERMAIEVTALSAPAQKPSEEELK